MKLPRTRPLIALIITTASFLHGAHLQAASNYQLPYTFTTLAGKAGVKGSSDGTGGIARFYGPEGVAVDANGNVYVADQYNSTIRKIDANGVVSTLAGQTGGQGSTDGIGTNALFNNPTGIAVDSIGNIYIADSGNNTIRMIDTNGVVTTVAGQAGVSGSSNGIGTNATFNNPFHLAVDGNGNLFVADVFNSEIRKIDINGVVTTIAGQAGISGSSDGIGTNATFAENSPQAVAADASGNLFVADTYNDTIRKIDTNGLVSTLAGKVGVKGGSDGSGTNATFDEPAGVAVDAGGAVYVADNSTIRKIDTNGVVTTLAGKYQNYKTVNGTGASAGFLFPSGIAVDGGGNVFVAENGSDTIRKGSAATNLPQTIKFGAIPKKVYGSPSFNLTATATSGLQVTFTSSNTNVVTVSGNTVSIVGGGTTTVTANQVGDSNFKAATPTKQVLTVTPASQTISFGAIPAHTYGDAPFIPSATASSSTNQVVFFTSSNPKVATVSSSTVTIIGAGLTTITASVPASTNFKAAIPVHQVLSVTGLPQTITFTSFAFPYGPNDQPNIQDLSSAAFGVGQAFIPIATSTSGLPVTFTSDNPRVISISNGMAHCHAQGTANITAHQTGNSIYSKATPVINNVLVIPAF